VTGLVRDFERRVSTLIFLLAINLLSHTPLSIQTKRDFDTFGRRIEKEGLI